MNGEQAEKAPETNKAIFSHQFRVDVWLSEARPTRPFPN